MLLMWWCCVVEGENAETITSPKEPAVITDAVFRERCCEGGPRRRANQSIFSVGSVGSDGSDAEKCLFSEEDPGATRRRTHQSIISLSGVSSSDGADAGKCHFAAEDRGLTRRRTLQSIISLGGVTPDGADAGKCHFAAEECDDDSWKVSSRSSQSKKGRGGFRAYVELGKDDPFGARLDFWEGSNARVRQIDTSGPIAKYNAIAPEGERILVGDFLVAINGVPGSSKRIAEAIRTGGLLEVDVRRPNVIRLPGLQRGEKRWGVQYGYTARSTVMAVARIESGGAICAWNKSTVPELRVREGDFILGVNDVFGSGKKLEDALRQAQTMDLVIVRPSRLHP